MKILVTGNLGYVEFLESIKEKPININVNQTRD